MPIERVHVHSTEALIHCICKSMKFGINDNTNININDVLSPGMNQMVENYFHSVSWKLGNVPGGSG